MKTAQLLTHFDRISEAPDAIPRLRRFILDLAVRGKLVEQDSKDEPASELLKRIDAEKVRLVKEGRIRKQEAIPRVVIEDPPFGLPTNWQWVRFGAIADFSAGRTPSRHDFSFWNTGDYPWVSIADMRDGEVVAVTKETVSAKAKNQIFGSEPVTVGTMIMSFKLTIGKISRLGIPAFHNEAIISIHPHCPAMDAYLFKMLPQFSQKGDTKDAIKGATLNRDSITNILLPLPPLTEQHRIVAKVDELMALCDRLEAAQAERESRRDRLAAASLNRLNQPADDPNAFQDHARFYFNHLPRLTTRPEHIKQLRQTILNLAVRGKLVPQDPNDEPGELTTIIKKGIPCNALPYMFDLPRCWSWELVEDLLREKMVNGISIKGKDEPPGVRALKLNSIKANGIDTSIIRYLPLTETRACRLKLTVGDFLLARGNGSPDLIARGALVKHAPKELTIFPDTMIRVRLKPFVSTEWFSQIWNSGFVRLQIRILAKTAVGLWKVSQDQIGRIVIALPPLAEQHRIVAKVEELMALCDRLEAQLTTTQTESRRLLGAVMNKALNDVGRVG